MKTLLPILLVFLLCSCAKKIYVPVEHAVTRTDSVTKSVFRCDTIIDRDTVTITADGTEVIRWRWRIKEVHDTVREVKTDSVYVEKPYPVEKVVEVERKRSWWETALMWCGGIAMVIGGAAAWWLYRRR